MIAQFDAGAKHETIVQQMKKIAATYPRKNKSRKEHVGLGIALGIDWETEIPSTDEQANRAKERIRGRDKK